MRSIHQIRHPLAVFIVVALAATACQAVALRNPQIPALDELLDAASVAEMNNDLRSAHDTYALAVKHYASNAKTWAAYGEHLRFYAHDNAAAADAFNKAVTAGESDPNSIAFAWRGLGELAEKSGNCDAAIELFQKSLNVMPLSDTYRSLCHLYVMRKDWTNAAEQARLAAERDADDPIAALLYAAQLERAGDKAKGQAEFERAMKLAGIDADGSSNHPVHCCVYYNAAGYQAVHGDWNRALKMLESFFQTPNHRHLTRQQIEDDPDFAKLKEQTEFSRLLDQYTN